MFEMWIDAFCWLCSYRLGRLACVVLFPLVLASFFLATIVSLMEPIARWIWRGDVPSGS